MPSIGILWNGGAGWTVGENCHVETVVCHRCGSLETAHVLHTKPEPLRLHRCGNCGRVIGRDHWHGPETVAAPMIEANGEAQKSLGPCAAKGCFVCFEDRQRGAWPETCPSCEPPKPSPQMSLF